jgi:perosamine synthetase
VSPKKFIPVSHPVFSGNEKKYAMECLDSMWISSIGRFIPLFEQKFAEFCDVEHAVSTCNGTCALHLALLGLGVAPGDEVLIPTLTYVSVANAIRYCGATPVLVDSEPRTFNLDPAKIEEKITGKTKGIIAVHLYGHPADMDAILEIARRRGLFVLEDAAESPGALYRGRKVGGIGDAGVFSFFGNKIVTTGEGGMVLTHNAELGNKIRILKGQGMDPSRRYWFPVIGYNYRMTNLEAAIGLAQTEQVDEHIASRRRVAAWYNQRLQALSHFLTLPVEESWARHSFWMYTVILKDSVGLDRDAVMSGLASKGIETRPIFYPMHVLPPYEEPHGSYPVAEALAQRGINLPTHGLLTKEDINYIAECLQGLCATPRP